MGTNTMGVRRVGFPWVPWLPWPFNLATAANATKVVIGNGSRAQDN